MTQPIGPHRYNRNTASGLGECLDCGYDLEADGNHLDAAGNLIPVDDPFGVLPLRQAREGAA